MQNLKGTTAMAMTERLNTQPVRFPRIARPDVVRTVTSGKAGFAQPLAFIPLEREDALETTMCQVRAYMDETSGLLMNTVYAVFTAYFVPRLAFDRFDGSMDALNRADKKKAERDGVTLDFIKSMPFGTAGSIDPLFVAAGLHATADDATVSADYYEAYQKVFEFRCRQRSEALWESVKDDYTTGLVPAFFDNPQMAMVKASFDTAQMEGEVPLTLAEAKIPLVSIGSRGLDGDPQQFAPSSPNLPPEIDSTRNWGQDIYAELEENGITVTLANIEMAKQTQAWARVRNQYSGIDDDDLVDLLMSGVSVPTISQAKPMLIDRVKVPFGMTQRFSTEANNLDVSATRGVAGATLKLRTPQANSGGIVVVQVECVPEQFWERSSDYLFLRDNDTRRPDRLLDSLDPQAVEIVENSHFDTRHTDPNGVGGYAPLNHGHVRRRFNLGGKFYKSDPTAPWSEDRNRVWASEPVDPQLSKEFWLTTDLTQDIFLQTTGDNYEFSLAADCRISGNTFIGPQLREATDDYDTIMERIDTARITGTPVNEPATTGDVVDDQDDGSDGETEPQVEPGSDVAQLKGE